MAMTFRKILVCKWSSIVGSPSEEGNRLECTRYRQDSTGFIPQQNPGVPAREFPLGMLMTGGLMAVGEFSGPKKKRRVSIAFQLKRGVYIA